MEGNFATLLLMCKMVRQRVSTFSHPPAFSQEGELFIIIIIIVIIIIIIILYWRASKNKALSRIHNYMILKSIYKYICTYSTCMCYISDGIVNLKPLGKAVLTLIT